MGEAPVQDSRTERTSAPAAPNPARHAALTTYVIAGVSGSGKSTVGKVLAARLDSQFFDGDDFHTEANKEKMRAGQALTDEDRQPWLAALAGAIQEHASGDKPMVFACSALKRRYRDVLAGMAHRRPNSSPVRVLFVVLQPPREVLRARLEARWQQGGHFMPPSLLDSQLADLEVDAETPPPAPLPAGPAARSSQGAEPVEDAAPMFILRDTAPPERLVDAILAHSAAMAAGA